MKNFYVLQPHVAGNDKYAVGDRRLADENEVQHLIELGVLGDKKPDVPQESVQQALDVSASEDIASLIAQLGERQSAVDRLHVELDQLRQDHAAAIHAAQDQHDAALAAANARADAAEAKIAELEKAAPASAGKQSK
jgi:uncharacterized protein involved in exopolysaccharide biosynthesis